jgi:hypothetical protein
VENVLQYMNLIDLVWSSQVSKLWNITSITFLRTKYTIEHEYLSAAVRLRQRELARFDNADPDYTIVFGEMCAKGFLESAQYISNAYGTAEIPDDSFHNVCANGHFHIFKYLEKTSRLRDICANGVIQSGNIDFIKYLGENYIEVMAAQISEYDSHHYCSIFEGYLKKYDYKDAIKRILFICEYCVPSDILIELCTYHDELYSLLDLSFEWGTIELINYAFTVVSDHDYAEIFREMCMGNGGSSFTTDELINFAETHHITFTEEVIVYVILYNTTFDKIINKFSIEPTLITNTIKNYLPRIIKKLDIDCLNSLSNKYKFMPNQMNQCIDAITQQFDIEKLKWIHSQVKPRIKLIISSDVTHIHIITKSFDVFKWFIDNFDISMTSTGLNLICSRDFDEYLFYIIDVYKYSKQDIINYGILGMLRDAPKIYKKLTSRFHFTLEEVKWAREGVS